MDSSPSMTSTPTNMMTPKVEKEITQTEASTFSFVSDNDKNRENGRKLTSDQKKLKRIMANRRSAKESRERRKRLMSNLEVSVDLLSKENAALMKENNDLKRQLAALMPQAQNSLSLQGVGLSQDFQALRAALAAGNGNGGIGVGAGSLPFSLQQQQQQQQLLQLQKDKLVEAALLRRQVGGGRFY